MKPHDRQRLIIDRIVADGAVDLAELAHSFTVSKMTIHRDLDQLEEAGLLRKIRGGATIEAGTRFESHFQLRERQGSDAKAAIARVAAERIEPGMTIMIDDGSTAAVLGRQALSKRPLTVITNNVAILDTLKGEAGITLIALGGIYSVKFNAYLGKATEDALTNLRADLAFLSSPAVADLAVFHMDDDVVRTKQAMMRAAANRVLIVNSARFGRTALYRLGALSQFDAVITDTAPSADQCAALADAGIPLLTADTEAAQP
ncbi:MAG: DeoR/GlpR transcriptional regulator [Devosiaceae bacterium]|nr:DeoR/GlpR transcriptional regulator [Devosiaceae bacterium MH13]